MKRKEFVHYCPALGKKAKVCKAWNKAYPDKIYYKCPFCGFVVDGEVENEK